MRGRTLGWRFERFVFRKGSRRIFPLSEEAAVNYKQLKEALLKRYDLTKDGYRLKFRKSRPEPAEKPDQFIHRLKN